MASALAFRRRRAALFFVIQLYDPHRIVLSAAEFGAWELQAPASNADVRAGQHYDLRLVSECRKPPDGIVKVASEGNVPPKAID
jgi:hypothetical protein